MKYWILLAFSIASYAQAGIQTQHVYRQEFEALKASPDYKIVFDEFYENSSVQQMRLDIQNYKQLSPFSRFVRFIFLALGSVVITAESMPKLYGYIANMCKAHGIEVPTVFVSTDRGFFNAAAQKLLGSSGAIIIGQKVLNDVTDSELEAVIAHEIGHIKHNHVNKMLLLSIGSNLLAYYMLRGVIKSPIASILVPIYLGNMASACIINKKFEQQADEFACKDMHKSEGLATFFKDWINKEKRLEQELEESGLVLQNNRSAMAYSDYLQLKLRYYLIKMGNGINNGFKWLYYNTPYGPHPSPESRIKYAESCWAAEQAISKKHNNCDLRC